MKWFGRKGPRDSARPALSRVGGVVADGWSAGSYATQVREAYCRNAIAQRAVRLIAEAIGGAPLVASDPALAALVNARSGGQPLSETVAAQLLLHGNAFIQVLRDADGQAAELFALRPERVGNARWRLSRLLRGRRGTEAAAGTQAIGDRFALLVVDSVRTIDLPLAAVGGEAKVMASGVGDIAGPVETIVAIGGRSILPPGPAHLRVGRDSDDAAQATWVRRSRAGWRWLDGADAPLAEESEAYDVVVTSNDAASYGEESSEAGIEISAGLLVSGAGISVRQRGTYGLSDAAVLQISKGE